MRSTLSACSHQRGVLAASAVAAVVLALPAQASEPAAAEQKLAVPASKSFGLLTVSRYLAIAESPEKKECPEGWNPRDRDQYLKQYPTPEAQAEHEKKFAYGYGNRGPNGESVFYNPELVVDPEPQHLSISDWAPGFDLDGKNGPEDYKNDEGVTGVDNQMNRVFGCTRGFRSNGFYWQFGNMGIRQYIQNRIFWEVSGVDDLVNDPEVTVRTYRGMDPIAFSGDDKPVPWATQRVDYERGPRYMTEAKAKIVDGVLITDAVDMWVPWRGIPGSISEFKMRGARLHVKLTATGAQGFFGGYADIDSFIKGQMSRSWGGPVSDTWSPPAVYRAMHDVADGYPGKDGKNTAVSIQFKQEFVAVHVRHSAEEKRQQQVVAR